jgi:hypothetical protein
MKSFIKLLLLGGLAVFMAGCASARTYQVLVNGYTEGGAPVLAPGASFFVMEDEKAANPLLEKEVKAKTERLLEKRGYVLVPHDRADYYLSFAYGLGSPQSVAVTGPSWGVGWGFGPGFCGPGVGYGVYWPGCGPYSTEVQALYDRWLRLTVVEGKYYRDTGKSRTVWVGDARSTGASADLREVLNFLLFADFEHFGKNTGKAVPATIRQNDPRLADLARIP